MSREGQMDNGVRDSRTYDASRVLTFVCSQGTVKRTHYLAINKIESRMIPRRIPVV